MVKASEYSSGDSLKSDEVFSNTDLEGSFGDGSSSCPEEDLGEDVEESSEFGEYARSLGLNPDTDADIMWMAKEAFAAPLPAGWTDHVDVEGRVYFCNTVTQVSSWFHPTDIVFRELVGLVKALRDERPLASEARRAASLRDHLLRAHQDAQAQLEGWSGPYESEQGQYFYNRILDTSTWNNPVDEQEHELATRQRVLRRCLFLEWPGSSTVESSSRGEEAAALPHLTSAALEATLGVVIQRPGVDLPKSPSSARSFHTAYSARSMRSGRSMTPSKPRGASGASIMLSEPLPARPQSPEVPGSPLDRPRWPSTDPEITGRPSKSPLRCHGQPRTVTPVRTPARSPARSQARSLVAPPVQQLTHPCGQTSVQVPTQPSMQPTVQSSVQSPSELTDAQTLAKFSQLHPCSGVQMKPFEPPPRPSSQQLAQSSAQLVVCPPTQTSLQQPAKLSVLGLASTAEMPFPKIHALVPRCHHDVSAEACKQASTQQSAEQSPQELDQLDLDTMISAFASDCLHTSLELPFGLSAHQRKRVKALVERYPKLNCESFGFGVERRVHVFKDSAGRKDSHEPPHACVEEGNAESAEFTFGPADPLQIPRIGR